MRVVRPSTMPVYLSTIRLSLALSSFRTVLTSNFSRSPVAPPIPPATLLIAPAMLLTLGFSLAFSRSSRMLMAACFMARLSSSKTSWFRSTAASEYSRRQSLILIATSPSAVITG